MHIKSLKTIILLFVVSIKNILPLSVLKFGKRFELSIFDGIIQIVNINLVLILKKTIAIPNSFWILESSISIVETWKSNSWNNIFVLNLGNKWSLFETCQAVIHVIFAPLHSIWLDFECCLHIIILFLLNLEMVKIQFIFFVFRA